MTWSADDGKVGRSRKASCSSAIALTLAWVPDRNAHGVPALGSRFRQGSVETDHWHRTSADSGRPYAFTTADQLLADFFAEVTRVLAEQGVADTVIGEDETKGGEQP